jgi:hypothetical protein
MKQVLITVVKAALLAFIGYEIGRLLAVATL